MKFAVSIIILVVLGIGAAVAAALLLVALRVQPRVALIQDAANKEVTVLVASRDLPSTTMLESSAIGARVMPAREAPAGAFSDPAQVTGRVLAVPVKAGQALTASSFPKPGTGVQLAGLLPEGKRAVTVSLSDSSSLRGLLYPGSIVDVLASFQLDNDDIGTAVSTTLLEHVEVLAVEQVTVAAEQAEESKDEVAAAPATQFGRSGKLLVTLMVDAKEAEALQLASEHGTVSLAMRNPNDKTPGGTDATVLSGGKLAQLAEMLAPTSPLEAAAEAAEPVPEPEPLPEPPPPREEPVEVLSVQVIRGQSSELVSFPEED